jgi:hypothetical protein
VRPIATATDKPGRPISVVLFSAAIAITANGRTADVLSEGGTVTPITTATNKRGRAINAGISPIRIPMAPTGRTVYVLDSPVLPAVGTAAPTNDGSVIPIATAINKPEKAITVGLGPTGFAITRTAVPSMSPTPSRRR